MQLEMLFVGAVHPALTRLGLAAVGVVLFGVIAGVRAQQAQRLPGAPVVVLSLLVIAWLFGATLVWGTGYATKIRWSAAWTSDGRAWQWSALLAACYLGVLGLAASLRSFAQRRSRAGWMFAALACTMFAIWSAAVNYSAAVAIVLLAVGVATIYLVADWAAAPASQVTPEASPGPRARIPVIVAATLLIVAWLSFALLWLVFREGENTVCDCWADNHGAWQYTAQFFVALIGGTVTAAAVRSYLRVDKTLMIVYCTAAVLAVGIWIAFGASATPVQR